MLLQTLWFCLMAASLLYGMLTGQEKNVLPALLEGTGRAVDVSLKLLGGYLFFGGLMNIVNNLRIYGALERRLKPCLAKILGCETDAAALRAASLNISANLLGLGNAATPYGIQAAQLLDASKNRHGLYMLLIINATSIQLVPTTVLTLRTAAGSVQPNAILLPVLLATAASTLVGCGLGLLCRCMRRPGHAA